MSRFFSQFFFPYAPRSCSCVCCERMFECMFSDACACHSFSLSVFPSIRWIVARFACVWTITCFRLTHPHTKKNRFFGYYEDLLVECDRFAACLFWPLKCDDRECKNAHTSREWKHEKHTTMPIQQLENGNSLPFWNEQKANISLIFAMMRTREYKKDAEIQVKNRNMRFSKNCAGNWGKRSKRYELILMIYFITVVKSISSQHPCNRLWFRTVDCISLHSIHALALQTYHTIFYFYSHANSRKEYVSFFFQTLFAMAKENRKKHIRCAALECNNNKGCTILIEFCIKSCEKLNGKKLNKKWRRQKGNDFSVAMRAN